MAAPLALSRSQLGRSEVVDPREDFAEALQRAKLDAMKELAYGASHEINNPLANIALRAQTLLKREDDPDKREMLSAIHRQAMRAHEMISDLMLFARPPALNRESVAISNVVEQVVNEVRSHAEECDIAIESTDRCTAPVWIDPMQLAVALRAVVENSINAIQRDGVVQIGSLIDDKGRLVIRVLDDGPGVPPDILPHVFDPFFSGREAGRGLGFGLCKCWRIITDHGGDVRLENRSPEGVELTMTLPTTQ